ncbi:MAG: 2-amino-4-hydroxy-6-hydroxymethyldihydropteridine diphosphokinase [Paramuribaculum sp.]|nr:2-amino-4-hydroxy-6-hydroxymethyldihydropteridine diphosphokinase [Paramuribaculum sp.]
MAKAYINIGSNIGDRLHYIDAAVAAIEARMLVTAHRSAVIYSSPWGYDSPNDFANIGITIHTSLSPETLLRELLDIEHTIGSGAPHRNPDGTYCDRPVDIDLIAVDNITLHTPHLTLPHPRMHLRPFVLIPMTHLWADWHHPRTNLTPAQSLRLITP